MFPGHITVANKFKYDGTPGTLSHQSSKLSSNPDKGKPLIDFSSDSVILLILYLIQMILPTQILLNFNFESDFSVYEDLATFTRLSVFSII